MSGLRSLGVKELNYKLVFVAQYAIAVGNKFNVPNIRAEETDEDVLKHFKQSELQEILEIKD